MISGTTKSDFVLIPTYTGTRTRGPKAPSDYAIVFGCDAHLLKYRWYINSEGMVYSDSNRPVRMAMHRVVTGATERHESVDHINHKRWDNRRKNLRIVTQAQNNQNRRGATVASKTGLRGVTFDPRYRLPWRAQVQLNGRVVYTEHFSTAQEAIFAAQVKRDQLGFLKAGA